MTDSAERATLLHAVESCRDAALAALDQLDWCVGYLHRAGKHRLADSIAANAKFIRAQRMDERG